MTTLPVLNASRQLLLMHKTRPHLSQPDNVGQVIEVLSIPLEDMRKGAAEIGL